MTVSILFYHEPELRFPALEGVKGPIAYEFAGKKGNPPYQLRSLRSPTPVWLSSVLWAWEQGFEETQITGLVVG